MATWLKALAAALEAVNGDVDGSGFFPRRRWCWEGIPGSWEPTSRKVKTSSPFYPNIPCWTPTSPLQSKWHFVNVHVWRWCEIHYSQALRRAQLARSRIGSAQHARSFHAGDIVYLLEVPEDQRSNSTTSTLAWTGKSHCRGARNFSLSRQVHGSLFVVV